MSTADNISVFSKFFTLDSNHAIFLDNHKSPITAGMIRHAAVALASKLDKDKDQIYLYSNSAADAAIALLAASLNRQTLSLLPQNGQAYCDQLKLDPQQCVGQFPFDCHSIEISTDSDAEIKDIPETGPDLYFFTSGSSGNTKKIHKPFKVLNSETQFWSAELQNDFHFICGTVSHQHIYGFLFRVLLPLNLEILSASEFSLSWEGLANSTGSQNALLVSSPAHLTRLPVQEIANSIHVKTCLSSGAALPESAAINVKEVFGVSPLEILGSTETGGVAKRQRLTDNAYWSPLSPVKASLSSNGKLEVESPFFPETAAIPMGDLAEFSPDGRFIIKGRADLLAKIEGKRVSLSRVTDALLSNDLVENAIALTTSLEDREKLSAIVVPTIEGKLKLAELGHFRFSRKLISTLSTNLEPAELPKRWRFKSEIPLNSQSKYSRSNLAKVFENKLLLNSIQADVKLKSEFVADIHFTVHNDLPWFKGHFPSTPILPGLALVFIAVNLCEEIWATRPKSHSINRLKFNQVLQPGDQAILSLKFNSETEKLSFKYTTAEAQISSGDIG